jgi:hypothetical protein
VYAQLQSERRTHQKRKSYATMTEGNGFVEQEPVPLGKQYMISTRENSDYKWQNMPDVIGCLEIPCVPDFQPHGEYTLCT